MKPIKTMRERGKMGGRPALDDKVSVGVYLSGDERVVLVVRIGAAVAKRLGWTEKTKVSPRMPESKRTLNLVEDPEEGVLLRRMSRARTLTLQQTVTGVLGPMPATQFSPLVIGSQLTITLGRAASASGRR